MCRAGFCSAAVTVCQPYMTTGPSASAAQAVAAGALEALAPLDLLARGAGFGAGTGRLGGWIVMASRVRLTDPPRPEQPPLT